MKMTTLLSSILSLVLISCAAQVIVPDRHTVLEDEAAGEWPAFEKEMMSKSKEDGPTAFEKVNINQQRNRLYNVLNGELANETK